MTTFQIPLDAPYSERQRAWLSGFFAGMQTQMVQNMSSAQLADSRCLHILFGTQTGNAESVAHDAASVAKAHGLKPIVKGMDEIDSQAFVSMEYLLIITSTYGEGEMPDNAQMLWQEMNSDLAPKLPHLNYSVLALGDTGYDLFCQAGILWDNRLAELGATRLASRVECDVDFETPAQTWMIEVIPQLSTSASTSVYIDSDTPEKSQ